jgi:hypothetical protein
MLNRNGAVASRAATKTTTKATTKTTTKKPANKTTTKRAKTNTAAAGSIVNTWSGAKVDPAKLPIGDASMSTSGPGVGNCMRAEQGIKTLPVHRPMVRGSISPPVKGDMSWPTARYSEKVVANKRVLTSNSLPVDIKSGTFPIAVDDPSYAYDRNPGKITETDTTITLPETGTVAAKASCMSEGPVGMLRNGVMVFNSLDGRGLDAVAHESQDVCQGDPAITTYHYHNVPSCLRNAATGTSTVVGWIADGFPIVVERDASGALPTNADLDDCHGRTSPIQLNGKVVTMYHYSATLEFPYFIGCYRGTPTQLR